jgi:hypothetical protein
LRDNPDLLAKLKQEYDIAQRQREWGQRQGAPGGAPGGVPNAGGPSLTPGQGGREAGRESAPEDRPADVPPAPPVEGGQPGDAGFADPQAPPDPAFLDPLLQEDIRNDWEFTVTFLVLLDPPDFVPGAEPAPADAAPAAPAASAR